MKPLLQVRKYSKVLYVFQNPVEYEDLVSISDFFVSNCGAGSVIAPIAGGYPQLCKLQNSVGFR